MEKVGLIEVVGLFGKNRNQWAGLVGVVESLRLGSSHCGMKSSA
jgi:hypothetical protein